MTYKLNAQGSTQGTAVSPTAGTSVSAGSLAIVLNSIVVLFVGNLGTASTGVSAATVGGTWTRIANVTGTGVGSEIWIGYNFNASADGTNRVITVTFAGSTKPSLIPMLIATSEPVTSAPTVTAVTATGNSVTPDPGTVTPAVGDLVLTGACWANVTAASAKTDTPGGAEQAGQVTAGVAATATRSEAACRLVCQTTTATKRTWTITSGQWAATNVKVALPNSTEIAALALKGTDTAAADAASTY